jgi:hypothetical protein
MEWQKSGGLGHEARMSFGAQDQMSHAVVKRRLEVAMHSNSFPGLLMLPQQLPAQDAGMAL